MPSVGLGSALITEEVILTLELGHLSYKNDLRGERRIEARDHTIPIQFVVFRDGPVLDLFARAREALQY